MLKGLLAVRAGVVACAVTTAALSLPSAPVAQGAVPGELAQVGGFGSSAGQFTYPSDLAVDPTDNSVYVLDEPGSFNRGAGFAATKFRIQKFSSQLGTPIAHAEIQTPAISGHMQAVEGLALDPSLHRLYALIGTEVSEGRFVAESIDAYSTETPTVGQELKAAAVEFQSKAGVFYEFPPVTEPANPPVGTVEKPHSFAVEPNHDLLVLGEDSQRNTVIRQITTAEPYASGASGQMFDDTENKLQSSTPSVNGIAVGPEGVVYVVGRDLNYSQGGPRGVAKLEIEGANSLENPRVTDIAGNQSTDAPPRLTGGTDDGFPGERNVGAQVAVSSDGSTVYAGAVITAQSGGLLGEGSYDIFGLSTAQATLGAHEVVFGGGPGGIFGGGPGVTSPKCHIASDVDAVAAGSGGVVYALDDGAQAYNEKTEEYEPTAYGFGLIEFGPDGSGCPTPTASFEIDGKPSEPGATIHQGDTATFSASGSHLNGEEPVEAQWDLDGSGKYETVVKGSPASLETSLKYLAPGRYAIGLKIVLKGGGSYGEREPATASGTLVVEPVPPVARFEVLPSANHGEALRAGQQIAPGEAVMFNAEESSDPVGSSSGGPTKELKTYRWEFGDGKVETKSGTEPEAQKYTRSFANAGSEPRQETVTLTVEDKYGTKSAPLPPQTLTIAGDEPVKEPIKEPVKEVPPTSSNPPPASSTTPPVIPAPPVSTPPAIKPLTRAQQLVRALKLCRKEKPKRRRVTCEKAAHKRYGPKRKAKKTKK